MSPDEIKAVLRRNRAEGRWPRSLAQIARRKRVSRSMVTTAAKDPDRYPAMRLYIESVLRAQANGEKAS